MLPKIKRFIKNNKKQVKIGIIILFILVGLLVLYKSLFYSNSESATYGVRIRDIKENQFPKEDIAEVREKSSNVEGVKEAKVIVKGRLIKFFVTFNEGVSTDDIKNRFNEMLGFMNEKIKGYYDVTFYSEQILDGKTKYPVTGYKHKGKTEIAFDVL